MVELPQFGVVEGTGSIENLVNGAGVSQLGGVKSAQGAKLVKEVEKLAESAEKLAESAEKLAESAEKLMKDIGAKERNEKSVVVVVG